MQNLDYSDATGYVRCMNPRRSEAGKLKGRTRYHDLGLGFAVEWNDHVEVSEVDGESLPHTLDMKLGVEGNRLVCESYSAIRRRGGSPVTAESLRRMPVAGATWGLLSLVRGRDRAHVTKVDLDRLPEMERVAVGYRLAYFIGRPPTTYVAELLNVSRDVAAKRVQKARRGGLLEQTAKGKKGV